MTGVTRRLLAAALAGALLLAPRAVDACSLGAGWEGAYTGQGSVVFIGAATSDTMRAGQGRNWHLGWLPFGGRSIHGQVMRVERLASSTDPALAAAVRRSGGRVVVVPWTNTPACTRVRWEQSARWLDVGTRGLFVARLRDPKHWAGGVPTVDLNPSGGRYRGIPYTGEPGRAGTLGIRAEWLAPDDLLDLVVVRPTYREYERDPDAAFAPLRRWAAAHPALAAREPAKEMLASADYASREAHAARRTFDLAGTWRVTLVLPVMRRAGDPRTADTTTFWVRTARRPDGSAGEADGVRAQACAALSERRLVGMRPWLNCQGLLGVGAEGSVAVGDGVRTDDAGRRRRAGSLDVMGVGFMLRWRRVGGAGRRVLAAGVDPGNLRLGTFTEWPDGRATFESFPGPPGASTGRATAVRVSTVTLPGD